MSIAILRGDARSLPLPDECVDLIITSPPYFGLRSYTDGGEHYAGQIGSEATPAEYVAALIACTAEWARVLKPEGSIFVNLGDKYDSGTTTERVNPGTVKDGQGQGWYQGTPRVSLGRPKSLLGLPWRYALAACDQLGLILRAEIIWAKPNGLPESVTDRVRRAHEQVFHFTRQPRYYSAVDEIRQPHDSAVTLGRRHGGAAFGNGRYATADGSRHTDGNSLGKLPGSVWSIPSQPLAVPAWVGTDHFAAFPMELPRRIIAGWSPPGVCTRCGHGRRPVVAKPGLLGGDNNTERLVGGRYIAAGFNGGQKIWQQRMAKPDYVSGYACACPAPDALATPALVVDPFGGTGTTALVAHALGRHGITIDRSADYCRLAAWRTSDRGELARAMQVEKPPVVPDEQEALFDLGGAAS